MAKTKTSFDDLLALKSRARIRTTLTASRLALNLPQAQSLFAHLERCEPAAQPLRLAVVHTYTSELLDPWLSLAASLEGFELQTYHASYGVTVQEAHDGSGLAAHRPDVTLLLLQREDLHPQLARPVTGLAPDSQSALRDDVLERFATFVQRFRRLNIGYLVVSFLPPIGLNGLGLYDAISERSHSIWWHRLKADIGRYLSESVKASILVDLDDVLTEVGRDAFFDRRLWYTARYPFAPAGAREFARRVMAVGATAKLPKAKVLVLDADNTLWGGIIGEDGIDGIALGPDYPGNAFVDFQKRILDYQQRGFILALCSKNNPADLDQVLKEHPHQILRDEHFAARRVNWEPKPDNLISLAEELNLGLESFVFVDDSDHECAAVLQRLPQIEVIQTPSRPIDIPTCLDHVARLEVLQLTDEDLVKTEMYVQERKRREMRDQSATSGGGLAEYLASLDMRMQVSIDCATHLTRLSQLTQKTNQFNLTTRRYNESQMQEMMSSDSWMVADFSLTDVFGNSGIVGLAIFQLTDHDRAELNTFLMSCRVIGRDAEAAFLQYLLRELNDRGVTTVLADYLPTPKNALAKDFLVQQGFALGPSGRLERNFGITLPSSEGAFPITVTRT